MKKLFLRVASVALVLLLLFSVGGCQKGEQQQEQKQESPKQTEHENSINSDLAIYIDEQENLIVLRDDEIVLQYPIKQINLLSHYPGSVYSSPFFYQTADPVASMKTFCGTPLNFSKATLTAEERFDGEYIDFSDYSDGERTDLLEIWILNNGALAFKDKNGECYKTDAGVFNRDEFMKNYQHFKFEN